MRRKCEKVIAGKLIGCCNTCANNSFRLTGQACINCRKDSCSNCHVCRWQEKGTAHKNDPFKAKQSDPWDFAKKF